MIRIRPGRTDLHPSPIALEVPASRAPRHRGPDSGEATAALEYDEGQWHPQGVRNLMLVALSMSTGCVDAVSWLVLGKVFSAFMTGNLVFLGLLAGGATGPDLLRVVISLVCFAFGAAVSGWVIRTTGKSERVWPFQVSVALSITALLEAGAVGVWKSSGGQPSGDTIPVLIGMLSAAMGIQTLAIASLRIRGVFTTAATATLAILMGDAAGWPHLKGEAQRLITVVLALVVGAAVGATLVDNAPMAAPLFPFLVTTLVLCAAALIFNDRLPRMPRTSRSRSGDVVAATSDHPAAGVTVATADADRRAEADDRAHSVQRRSR
jgi:uncharacterized membrane protein YoaK (UPF0700 family)